MSLTQLTTASSLALTTIRYRCSASTQPGAAGTPTAVSRMAGPLITSCVDAGPWNGDNNWNNEIQRARAMMEHWLSVSRFLVVHNADDEQPWLTLGFRELEPPAGTARPLRVFAYGEAPPSMSASAPMASPGSIVNGGSVRRSTRAPRSLRRCARPLRPYRGWC
jgi:hypothetical protein